jgi:hypothetical protein
MVPEIYGPALYVQETYDPRHLLSLLHVDPDICGSDTPYGSCHFPQHMWSLKPLIPGASGPNTSKPDTCGPCQKTAS